MYKKSSVLGCILALLSFVCLADDNVKWGYEGNTGPAHWGELHKDFAVCKTGLLQAPIDIPTRAAATVESPIQPHYTPSAAEVINNGHTIQVSLANGGIAKLGGIDYKIVQFHMHTPGEEKVDGTVYPFNAHLVHQGSDGKFAVIGVFFKVGKENENLKPIFAAMPRTEGQVALGSNYDLTGMLPSVLSYYSYSGSLTTPGCTEGVTFYILKTPVEMSAAQLMQFQGIFPMNARPVMPLNDRKITQGN